VTGRWLSLGTPDSCTNKTETISVNFLSDSLSEKEDFQLIRLEQMVFKQIDLKKKVVSFLYSG
jgi:hypothetical protein